MFWQGRRHLRNPVLIAPSIKNVCYHRITCETVRHYRMQSPSIKCCFHLFHPWTHTHTHTPTHTHTHKDGCVYAARSSRQTKIAAPSPAVFINPSFSEVALLKLTPVITSLHLLHLQPSLQDMSTVPEGCRVQPPTGQTEPPAGRAAAPTRQGLNPQRPGFDSPLSLIKGPKNILKRLSTDFLPLREEPEVMFSPLSVGC